MKIGIDIRNIGKKRTGDEAVFFNLTRELLKIGGPRDYYLFTDLTDEKALEEIKISLGVQENPRAQIVSLKCSGRFAWNFWRIGSYLRRNPLDWYLTQYIVPFFVPQKTKIADIIHDISFVFYPEMIKRSDLFFLKKLIPWSLNRSAKIIAVSRFTRQEIISHYKISPEKIDFVYNAADPGFVLRAKNLSEEEVRKTKEKYGLPEKYILYLGTFQPRKNLIALVEAFGLARKEIAPVKLVLAGGRGRNFDKKIEKFIKKTGLAGEVFFPGYIDEADKAAVFSGAEIFCLPSLYEGFGIPILEAFSAGTPAAVSEIPTHREVAEDSAAYFNPHVSGELYKIFLDFLKKPALKESFINRGRSRLERFSWENSARKLLEIFEGQTENALIDKEKK